MTDNETTPRDPSWERDMLERLAFSSLVEQRRARRWGIFFKLLFATYLILLLALSQLGRWGDAALSGRHTALVDMNGVIESEGPASADSVIAGLRAAFEAKNTAGVILRVNSPGGSPVQSGYIYDEISRLRKKYPEIPLYAVIGDICASGCYYVAAAANKIYGNQASIVGSIGVIMDGFGFVDSMKKLGVERRLVIAGENKAMLDPFSPANPKQTRYIQGVLNEVHNQFIDAVRTGRGEVLKETPDMFSGLIWTGERAKALGLIDELASASQVARDVVGAEDIIDFTVREDLFQEFAKSIGSSMGKALSFDLQSRGVPLR